jgi:DNA-binding CsgD family transcriptional regulator
MHGSDYRSLMTVIDRLYAAALESSKWPRFLSSMASMFEADNAFISQIDHQTRVMDYRGLPQLNRELLPPGRYPDLIDYDPRWPSFHARLARPVHCRMEVGTERLQASRTYREYLNPLNIEYTMVVCLPVRDHATHDFGLTRGRAGKAFNASECDLLSELVPHLARALEIHRIRNQNDARPIGSAPPSEPPSASGQDILARNFGLSPTQARLTMLLMTGQRVKDIAAILGIADDSARQYLKRIYRKTGTHRQTDLVRIASHALTINGRK